MNWALRVNFVRAGHVNFMRAELCDFEFYESWELGMWGSKLCDCEFYESWALQMWILWVLSIENVNFMIELSIMNVNFIGAEHCECQLYESWALCMWIFKRAELCESEFYESWALRMWILWELSIVNVNFLRVGLSECHQILQWWEGCGLSSKAKEPIRR